MSLATDVRVGNVLRHQGKLCKIVEQSLKGTGKFGKTVHLKMKGLEDAHVHEIGIRAEDKVELVDVEHVKMQYLYKDGDSFYFMNMSSYEQFPMSSSAIGQQEAFLKENLEIDVLFAEGKPLSVEFPKTAQLKVMQAPPAVKGAGDSTYKEVELENGLKVLVPQFIKEGDSIVLDVESLSYIERVTLKSL